MATQTPIRILHVGGRLVRGGVQTWLVHVLRHFDLERFPMDFLVHTDEPCAYDDEVLRLGCRIIPCLNHRNPRRYARNFHAALEQHGPYDVVHSHVHHYSGYVLKLAHRGGVPRRIAHSHNVTDTKRNASLPRRLYLRQSKARIRRHATRGLACSRLAAESLYGRHWESDSRWQILHYGIDLTPFEAAVDRVQVRDELGLPHNGPVIGHVGSFTHQKNHDFILKIAERIVRNKPTARLLLVGDGPLRPQIKRQAKQMGIEKHLVFAGDRGDVPRLMRGAMDVFLFPSRFEGLGIVLIEAQAAGLPCVFSDVVPDEAFVVDALASRLSLSQPASDWSQVVLERSNSQPPQSTHQALHAVQQSDFNIENGLKCLEELYSSDAP